MTHDHPTMLARSVDWLASAFPAWHARRLVARHQVEFLATLRPLRNDRASGALPNDPSTLDAKINYWDRQVMVDTFDTMVREAPLLSGLVNTFVVNTVPPTGLRPIPATGNTTFDGELSRHFTAWAEDPALCDARKICDLWQYQQVLLRSVLGHGDGGILCLADGTIQGVSAPKIATPAKYSSEEGLQVHQGVYTGRGVAPRGYYVSPRDRYGRVKRSEFQYLPAEHFLHCYRPESFDDYRAASAFLSSYHHLRMAEQIMHYKLFQQKMASVFGIAIHKSKDKSTSPLQRLGVTNSAAESRGESKTTAIRPDFELFPGMGITLDADEDITVVDSKSPGNEFENFVRLVCRYIGLSCGLPLEFVLQDWSRANYYGNRMASLMGKRVLLSWWQVPAVATRRLYRRRVEYLIETGAVSIPGGLERSPYACEITLPPPIEVDPEKAFRAHMLEVAANVNTKEAWAKQQGHTVTDILEQRKTEHEAEKAAGLPMVASIVPGVQLLTDLEASSDGNDSE
jgi:capsid protein